MNWPRIAYVIAGTLLIFWLLLEDDTPIINTALMSLLIGPFVGVPLFVIMLVCFGNWPVIIRDVWFVISYPFVAAWNRARALVAKETPHAR